MLTREEIAAAEAHLEAHTLAQLGDQLDLINNALMIAADRFGGPIETLLAACDFEAIVDAASAARVAAEYDYHETIPYAGSDPSDRFLSIVRHAPPGATVGLMVGAP